MHASKHLRFKINQLRQDKIIYSIESIAVFVFALFASAFLPNLLLRYVYSEQNLTEIPPVLEYIPVIAFVVGVGFFLYAMIGNIGRRNKIAKLEKELELASQNDCCDCDCENCAVPQSSMSGSSESIGLLAEKMRSSKTRRSTKKA